MPLKAFILQHLEGDLHRLLLSANRYPNIDIPYAVSQIEALRKVKHKVPAWFNPDLKFPPGLSLEQSSSESTARFKASLCSGNRIADLTGGMGIDSYYWASSFKTVDYIEQSELLCALARHNFATLGASNIAVHHQDAADFIAQAPLPYDLVYLDPARRDQHKNKVFLLTDCTPDIVALQDTIFQKSPKILLKTAPMMDIALAVKQLHHVAKIWIISVQNECKEVLYLLDQHTTQPPDEVEIVCVDTQHPTQFFTTSKQLEKEAVAPLAPPMQYLYEPFTSVLKAGAFHSFATQYGLHKLDTHTHLYTSEALVADVPARVFRIKAITKYDSKAVLAQLSTPQANITVRNFPDTVETIRKKLKIRDGGETYLFGVTAVGIGKAMLVCERGFD